MQQTKRQLPRLPGWLSLKEAADLAGRSRGSIRRAIARGDLAARRLQGRILIPLASWQQFVLTPGSPEPSCTQEPVQNYPTEEPQARILVTLTVQLRAGQQEALEQRLHEFAEEERHRFPGTLDRLIRQSQSRSDIVLVLLVWDPAIMPPEEEREAMLAALRADLATVLDWKTEERYEQRMLLHTL